MTAKVMVSFPDEFLAEVDRVARSEHRSRSELVREALRLYIGLRGNQGQPATDALLRQAVAMQDSAARPTAGSGQNRTAAARPVREAPDEDYQTLDGRDRRIGHELQRQLAKITPVLDLRIFGSRARGDAAPDSDLDVFIEVEEATPELRKRISEIAWEVGFKWERLISTVVATRDDLEQGAMGANPLMRNIEREGIRP